MQILEREGTVLGGATTYGAGNYGDGVYSGGAGNYVTFGPTPYGVVWEPDSIICNTDSQSFTTFAVYLNEPIQEMCIGSTTDGNQGQVNLPAVQVTANVVLICVWFGGDVGSNASASLIGESGELAR